MLKKLLPKLQEKLKKLLRSPQQKTEQVPPEERNLSPNLLLPIETDNILVRVRPQIIKSTILVVRVIGIVFFILLALNYVLDRRLASEKLRRDELIVSIDQTESITNRAKDVATQLSIYRDTKDKYEKVSEKFNDILAGINKHVDLENISYRRESKMFTVHARAAKATQFAFMIGDVLEVSEVRDITIRTVELKPGDDREYVAILDVNLE